MITETPEIKRGLIANAESKDSLVANYQEYKSTGELRCWHPQTAFDLLRDAFKVIKISSKLDLQFTAIGREEAVNQMKRKIKPYNHDKQNKSFRDSINSITQGKQNQSMNELIVKHAKIAGSEILF